MGYNKYLWNTGKKETEETFGQVKISPIDEAAMPTFEVVIHYGAGHKCEIADYNPDNVVPKALYLFSISYYNIIRISDPAGIFQDDGIIVETRRIINSQMNLYGHTRFYLVKTFMLN